MSGNLTLAISDHLPSFTIFPKSNQNHIPKKHNLYKRDRTNFKEKEDANLSFNIFHDSIENLLDKYLPLKDFPKRL